ncbi:HU family DNA-binding protein [Deinococcus altitudinis]|uniref:HU family DNA-binding protein n=1 Tax=Deinococcus altitudinis TaxID=468914 RepID=UPI0038922B79
MKETNPGSAACAANAPGRTLVDVQQDSSQASADQPSCSSALLLPTSPAVLTTDGRPSRDTMNDRVSTGMTIDTLRADVSGHSTPHLALASEAALNVALTRLHEQYGTEITVEDLKSDVSAMAVETAMAETGELIEETIIERLADATGIDTTSLTEWTYGNTVESLRRDMVGMARITMEYRPELDLQLSSADSSLDIFRRVAEATGVLTAAEILFIAQHVGSDAELRAAVNAAVSAHAQVRPVGKAGKTKLTVLMVTQAGLTRRDARAGLNAALNAIAEALKAGQTVSLPGVGTLSVKATAARTGVHPGTHEKIQIAAGKKVSFKVASDLKKTL